ncbi:MAG: sugar ABC transporter permease [Bacilli bacterium]|nr:sugar ABC transporter permease [Bacilli bacterium]
MNASLNGKKLTPSMSGRNLKLGNKSRAGEIIFIIAMLAIPVINWLVFWLYVNFDSILLAFQNAYTQEWTTDNFVAFWSSLTRDGGDLKIAFMNTALYFLSSLVIIMPLSLFISYFIYKKVKGYKVFRIIFYLPCIIPASVLTTVFAEIVNPGGVVNVIMDWLHLSYPDHGILGTEGIKTAAIIAYTVIFGLGGDMLIFSSAMSRIPIELLEAGRLDGLGPFRELTRIILPLIWPTVSTKITLLMTGLFTASGPILLLVNGMHNDITISFWIFNTVRVTGDYGIVAAAGLCFTAVAIPLILGVRKIMGRFSEAEY